jgi:hypothetical protein
MKVHLIKDSEVGIETFSEVVDLLKAVPGPIEFYFDSYNVINFDIDDYVEKKVLNETVFEKSDKQVKSFYNSNRSPFKENLFDLFSEKEVRPIKKFSFPFFRKTTSWTTLFDKCNIYRRDNNIPKEEFVLLLTEVSNTNNWFASLDEKMPFNGFIHTSDWNHFIKCQDSFPIAFEVIALILQKHMFNDYNEARTSVHIDPIGCVNDLCLEKKNIILKLRTADVCIDCMTKLKDKLSVAYIQHALLIMESLRVKMLFSQNFKQNVPLSRIIIDASGKICLPEFGNIEIKLKPLEKAIYLLYLNHPEGIRFGDLYLHKNELNNIYMKFINHDDGDLESIKNIVAQRIANLVNITTNGAAERVAKIKSAFVKAIGEELAKQYYIQGGNNEVKRVLLDRGLVG